MLLTKGLSYKSHKANHVYFSEHFVKAGIVPASAGRALQKFFECRQGSDYEFIRYGKGFVEEQIAKANEFAEIAERYLNDYLEKTEGPDNT
jgi:uncharacterized protein (UPF0332 family)